MVILFDVDKSTSVLRDHYKEHEWFQIRPLKADYQGEEYNAESQPIATYGMDFHLYHYLNLLFEQKLYKYRDKVFGYEDEMIIKTLSDKGKELGLHTIILDSLSGMGESLRLSLIDNSKFSNMSKDLWGKYAVKVGKVVNTLRDLPVNVIVTSHIDYTGDDIITQQHVPAIKGSQKTDMLRWFDVIIYTHVDDDGSVTWQVKKDSNRPYIRSRIPIPEWEGKEFVSPDFSPIYGAYDKVKVLLVGDSGTGKTTSLKTIPQRHGKKTD